MDEGAELPEHTVDDGSVMIQVLTGKIQLLTGESDNTLSLEDNKVITLGEGVNHTIRAEEATQLLLTIMRG